MESGKNIQSHIRTKIATDELRHFAPHEIIFFICRMGCSSYTITDVNPYPTYNKIYDDFAKEIYQECDKQLPPLASALAIRFHDTLQASVLLDSDSILSSLIVACDIYNTHALPLHLPHTKNESFLETPFTVLNKIKEHYENKIEQGNTFGIISMHYLKTIQKAFTLDWASRMQDSSSIPTGEQSLPNETIESLRAELLASNCSFMLNAPLSTISFLSKKNGSVFDSSMIKHGVNRLKEKVFTEERDTRFTQNQKYCEIGITPIKAYAKYELIEKLGRTTNNIDELYIFTAQYIDLKESSFFGLRSFFDLDNATGILSELREANVWKKNIIVSMLDRYLSHRSQNTFYDISSQQDINETVSVIKQSNITEGITTAHTTTTLVEWSTNSTNINTTNQLTPPQIKGSNGTNNQIGTAAIISGCTSLLLSIGIVGLCIYKKLTKPHTIASDASSTPAENQLLNTEESTTQL